MFRQSLTILFFTCLVIYSAGPAAEAPPALEQIEQINDPLPPPDLVEHDEELEPEVTIIQREDATVEEYRANGRLYMVKVTPFVGKPYYFVDRDGDGLMESRMSDLYNPTQVPQWVIFSW
jgi:hypothetical protein